MQAISSFWWDLEKVSQKSVPSYTFCSLWRLTWVFDGTCKIFHKKVCPVTGFFAVETNLSFWWDLEKFPQKSVPSHTFLRCGDYLKFLSGLGKFRQKGVTSYTFFRSADYLKFLMGLGKFRQKKWPVTRFFAVETKLTFWWDLGKFSQKSVPSHTFLRCWDYLKFLMGLGKFRQKGVTSYTFFSQCRLSWVFDGSWKVSTKKVWPVTRFFAVETNLSFWWDLEKFSQKKCAQSQVSSLWRLTWVFDAT